MPFPALDRSRLGILPLADRERDLTLSSLRGGIGHDVLHEHLNCDGAGVRAQEGHA